MKVDESSSPKNLSTTPMRIGLPSGGTQRTSLEGLVRCNRSTRKQFTHQIDRATLVLQGDAETLQADLIEPIMLIDPPMGIQPLPLPVFGSKLVGDWLAGNDAVRSSLAMTRYQAGRQMRPPNPRPGRQAARGSGNRHLVGRTLYGRRKRAHRL